MKECLIISGKNFAPAGDYCKFNLGVDFGGVEEISPGLLRALKIGNFAIFGASVEVVALLNLLNLDKKVEIFLDKEDFLSNRNRLVKRHFKCVA